MQAATGEEVSAEDLGGADLHCRLVNWRVKGRERATWAREGRRTQPGGGRGGERAT